MSETILPVLSALVPNSGPVLGSHTENIIHELKGLSLDILTSKQPGALPVCILSVPSFYFLYLLCIVFHLYALLVFS